MSEREADPHNDPVTGDMFGPMQQEISKRLFDATMRLPAVLEKQVEGDEGPVDIPPEQWAEVMQKALQSFMHFVPQMAGALDVARARITKLEARVAELEGGAPGNGG